MVFDNRNSDLLDFSPLNLLYSAWSDQQPTVNQRVTENSVDLDKLLVSLPEQARHKVCLAVYRIVEDNEQTAFLDGLRVGLRLSAELAEG